MKKVLVLLVTVFFINGIANAQYKLYENGLNKYKTQDYAGAIKNLDDFLSNSLHDKKFDIDAYYYRGLAYYKTNEWKKAVEDFQETLLLNHANKGNIYWFMAKAFDNLSQFEDAVDQYSSAIRELGADKETKSKLLYERSAVQIKSGRINSAYDDLKAAVALNPGNAEARKELDKLDKQGLANRVSTPDTQKQTQQPVTKKEEKKEPIVTKKDEPVVAKKDEPKNNPSTQPNTQPATSQEGETSAEDIVAARLRSSKKANTDVPKHQETAGNSSQPTQQQKSSNPNSSPASSIVVTEQPGAGKTTVPTVINTIADAYKDERRFALVIGNSKYPKEIGVLKNPVNDATDIAKELQNSHFDVQLLTDATYGQMRAAMLKFKEKVDAGEKDKTVALFYYAGHGLAHEDENYLVPIDAMIEYEDDISRYCFGVQRMVLANMERSNSRMNIVILDACRNNPFPALTRSAGQQGLSEMKRARGSFIAYATAPGSVASDGSGRNGLYTQELLKAMRKPGLTIEQVFKEVRASVGRMSGDKQNTWDSSNIVGEFYFKF